jgi:hypothetical protein
MGREVSLRFLQDDVTKQIDLANKILRVGSELQAIEQTLPPFAEQQGPLRRQIQTLLEIADSLMNNATQTGRSASTLR